MQGTVNLEKPDWQFFIISKQRRRNKNHGESIAKQNKRIKKKNYKIRLTKL